MLARNLTWAVVPVFLTAALLATADAASSRNDKVYQAAEANRAGALELLKEIVNIDSGTGDAAGGTVESAAHGSRTGAR